MCEKNKFFAFPREFIAFPHENNLMRLLNIVWKTGDEMRMLGSGWLVTVAVERKGAHFRITPHKAYVHCFHIAPRTSPGTHIGPRKLGPI